MRKLKEFAKMCCACSTSPKLALPTSVVTSHVTCFVSFSLFVSTSAVNFLERPVSEMTYYVLSGTLNPTLTHSVIITAFHPAIHP